MTHTRSFSLFFLAACACSAPHDMSDAPDMPTTPNKDMRESEEMDASPLDAGGRGDASHEHMPDMGSDLDAFDMSIEPEPWRVDLSHLGPYGGFVSAITFAPDGQSIHLSGDDGSGLYVKASNASEWTCLKNAPLNWSAYDMELLEDDVLVVPNHFGRGLATSIDGGTTWRTARFPQGAGLIWASVARAREAPQPVRLLFATNEGVVYTDDMGERFEPASFDTAPTTPVQSLIEAPGTGHLYAGDELGGLYLSKDDGATFMTVLSPQEDNLPITQLAATRHALYIGYAFGYLGVMRGFSPEDLSIDVDPPFTSSLWTRVHAISGENAQSDTVFVGTVASPNSPKPHGLFISEDGAQSFTAHPLPQDASVFSMAFNPVDADHILIGSVNGPVLETRDGAETFVDASEGIMATAALAVSADVQDSERIALSSTTILPGTGAVHLSEDAGQTWRRLEALKDEDILGVYLHGDTMLVGASGRGILRSDDRGATFAPALEIGTGIHRFTRSAQSSALLAIPSFALGVSDIEDAKVFRSDDEGVSWEAITGPLLALDIDTTTPPTSQTIVVGAGAFALDESGRTAPIELGLEEELGDEVFATSLGIAARNAGAIMVGDQKGRLWFAEGCTAARAPCAWTQLPSPAPGALISGIESATIDDRRVWLLSAWVGDLVTDPTIASGLFLSEDDGLTWMDLREQMNPSTLAWSLERTPDPGRYLAGRWGGGALSIHLTREPSD